MFHLAAGKAMVGSEFGVGNIKKLALFFVANRALSTLALVGVAITLMRRDWRIVPLLAWFLTTLILLRIQVPFWPRHAIVLIPPLIAFVALGLQGLPAIPLRRPIAWQQGAALLMGLLALAVIINSSRHDYYHYQDLRTQAATTDQWMIQVAADVERADDTRPIDYYRRAICRCAGKSRYPPMASRHVHHAGVKWVSHEPRAAAGRSRSAGSCDPLCYRSFYPCGSLQFPSLGRRTL